MNVLLAYMCVLRNMPDALEETVGSSETAAREANYLHGVSHHVHSGDLT